MWFCSLQFLARIVHIHNQITKNLVMKAKTKNTNRILSTIGLLVLAVSIGHGQGLLAESAMKLFRINQAVAEVNAPEFTFVKITEEKDSFSFKNLFAETFQNRIEREAEAYEYEAAHITRTIIASTVEISFESDVETEQWMTSSLSNNLEADLTVENWMTESFTESVEAELTVEDWMTESFTESVEAELTVEDWMTVSLDESLEEELKVEDWMLTLLTAK